MYFQNQRFFSDYPDNKTMWSVLSKEGNIQENYNHSHTGFDDHLPSPVFTEKFVGKTAELEQTLLAFENNNIETKPPQISFLTSSLSHSELKLPSGTIVPPNLPKMFLDLLVPVQGLKSKKLPYDCSLCGDSFATWNSLVTHNKSHRRPACLACGAILPSVSSLGSHRAYCQGSSESVVVTSKYGRSRPVKSYLANSLKQFHE